MLYIHHFIAGPPNLTTPFNVLDTPGKKRQVQYHQRRVKALLMKNKRLDARLEKLQQESSVTDDDDLSSDLISIMSNEEKKVEELPGTDIQRLFWEQQVHAYMIVNFVHIFLGCA